MKNFVKDVVWAVVPSLAGFAVILAVVYAFPVCGADKAKKADQYETAEGLVTVNDKGVYFDVALGKSGDGEARVQASVTFRLVFRTEELEKAARALAGKTVSLDGRVGRAGFDRYWLVEGVHPIKE